MIKDKDLVFSTLQTITTSAASEDYINLTAAGDAYNDELFLVCRVGTAFTGATSMAISVQTDTDSGFATALQTLVSSPVIAEASLTADTEVFKIRVPKGMKKFIRLYYTVVGTHSTGTLDAFLATDIQQS
jgi:hypothetical protein